MKIEELLQDIDIRNKLEQEFDTRTTTTVEDVTKAILQDPDVVLSMSLELLQECGNLLDRLTDRPNGKLTKAELRELHKASDEVFDFLNNVDIETTETAIVEGMEKV